MGLTEFIVFSKEIFFNNSRGEVWTSLTDLKVRHIYTWEDGTYPVYTRWTGGGNYTFIIIVIVIVVTSYLLGKAGYVFNMVCLSVCLSSEQHYAKS